MDKLEYKKYLLKKITMVMNDYTNMTSEDRIDYILGCMLQVLTELVEEKS